MTLGAYGAANCKKTAGCLGVECCMDLDFYAGTRTICYTYKVDDCTGNIVYTLENKMWTKSIAGILSKLL